MKLHSLGMSIGLDCFALTAHLLRFPCHASCYSYWQTMCCDMFTDKFRSSLTEHQLVAVLAEAHRLPARGGAVCRRDMENAEAAR